VICGLGIAYLVVAAVGKWSYALPRLLRDVEEWSAVDLKYRHNEVLQWFAGNPVYGVVDGAVYPPASHAILWPLLGWMPLDPARLLWAGTTVIAALAIAVLAYRLCSSAPPIERLLVAGLAFASYPIQMAIFVGQLGVHVAALAIAGAFVLLAVRPSWVSDVGGATLLAASLVKPTLAAPLVAAALVAAGRVRPALLVAAVYGGLTAVAAAAQPADLVTLVGQWLKVTGDRVSLLEGAPSFHLVLAWLGLGDLSMVVSLLVLVAMTGWLWRQRGGDPWVLVGAAAIVSRFWAHGRLYDDALLILAAVALLRIARRSDTNTTHIAGFLFAAVFAVLLTPTWAFFGLGDTVLWLTHTVHTAVWLAVFVFIAGRIREGTREHTASVTGRTAGRPDVGEWPGR
jgi:hypothetical protein